MFECLKRLFKEEHDGAMEKKEQVSVADLISENCRKAVNEVAPILQRTGYFKDFKMYADRFT